MRPGVRRAAEDQDMARCTDLGAETFTNGVAHDSGVGTELAGAATALLRAMARSSVPK
jgi:hypothetical protein